MNAEELINKVKKHANKTTSVKIQFDLWNYGYDDSKVIICKIFIMPDQRDAYSFDGGSFQECFDKFESHRILSNKSYINQEPPNTESVKDKTK